MLSRNIFIGFNKSTGLALLGVVLFCLMQSTAEAQTALEQAAEESNVAAPKSDNQSLTRLLEADVLGPVDTSRDYIAGQFVDFAASVDRFFGDDRNYLESNQSVLQLDITRVVGRGAERRFVLSGRAKVHLPNTEKRLHLVLESNPDKNVSGEDTQTKSTPVDQVAAPESFAAAARIENTEKKLWHLSADGGIQLKGLDTSPFARTRGRLEVPLDKWSLKAAETFFWFRNTGTGATTELDLERHINEPELFRASTNATWLMKTGSFDLHQSLSLYHTLNERTALLYQVGAVGVSKPKMQVSEYILLFLYRYRLHHQWVYAELSPQLHYPQGDKYRVRPMLVMRLELLFDNPR